MFPEIEVLRYRVGPVAIDALTLAQLLEMLASAARRSAPLTATYLNAHGFSTAFREPETAALLERFDVVFCDGVGLRWGLALLGARLPERMTPPDFVNELARRLAGAGGRLFLLGDGPGVAEAAARRIEWEVPGVVAGTHHGFYAPGEEERVAEAIAGSGAGTVVVGMGIPLQERVILRLSARLPGRVWLAAGGLFRWLAGVERRGPRWLTDRGFEWLSRLLVQPRRTARRYLVGLPAFALLVLRMRLAGPRPRAEVRSLARVSTPATARASTSTGPGAGGSRARRPRGNGW